MTAHSKTPARAALLAAFAVLAAACSTPGGVAAGSGAISPGSAAHATSAALPLLHREDVLWLDRVSFGLDSASVADYRRLGRAKFLERQLQPQEPQLPAPVAAEIAALEVTHADPEHWLADVNAQYKTINAMPDGADKEQAL